MREWPLRIQGEAAPRQVGAYPALAGLAKGRGIANMQVPVGQCLAAVLQFVAGAAPDAFRPGRRRTGGVSFGAIPGNHPSSRVSPDS